MKKSAITDTIIEGVELMHQRYLIFRRFSLLIIIVIMFGLLLTACGSKDQTATTGTTSAATSTAPATDATSPATTTPASTAAPSQAPAPSVNAGGEVSSCTTDQLVASASRGSGYPGHEGVIVVVQNSSATTCTLEGYPSARLVDAYGKSITSASVHLQWPSPGKITLQPGDKAATTIYVANPQVSECPTTTAASVQLTLPGQSASISAKMSLSVCNSDQIQIVPLSSGVAQNGP